MNEIDWSNISNDELFFSMSSEDLSDEDRELAKKEYNKRLIQYKKDLVEASINELKRIDFAQSSMVGFVPYLNSRYDMQWFHKYIMERLDAFERGEVKRLMIWCPPQCGKSELSTRNLVPYLVGKNPRRKVAVVCYGKDLVSGFNRDIKANLSSKEYKNLFPNIELGTRTGEMAVFENSLDKIDIAIKESNGGISKGGFIKTTAITAPLTGTAVDILVMDDIYKDFDEAQSETTREQRWNWWWAVANSRLHNNSQVVFLMTRWHQEDLAGKLIESQPGQWEILRFPALKDNFQADYDKRKLGEPLWGDRHSKERMEAVKAQNPVTFNALYQQDPKPPENLLVFGDWGELNSWNPRGIKFYGLDLGTNDPTALVEIWVDKDTIYLHELIYEVGLNNKSLMDRMRKLKVDGIIITDTNEPKTTNELRENGFKMKSAIKGKYSIQAGIKKMKEFKVFFSPTSFNIKMERNNYVFITSGGKITNEPIASWNHIIDCSRFAVYTMFFRGKVNKSTTKKKSRIRSIGK